MDSAKVESTQILQLFAELNSKRQKQVHRQALKQATAILVKGVKSNFRQVVKKPNARNR